MICVIYGTTGELIKLAPVLVRIRAAGGTYLSATTGQQVQQIPALLDELSLPQPDVWLVIVRTEGWTRPRTAASSGDASEQPFTTRMSSCPMARALSASTYCSTTRCR